jgi:hypothetical protein
MAVQEAGLAHGLGFSTPQMDVYQTTRVNVLFSIKVVSF